MKIVDCIQGSDEWRDARRGRPTASRFGCIVTPTGKPVTGEKRRTYMLELLYERLAGRCFDHYVSAPMMRGTELEEDARRWYVLASGQDVSQVGFIEAAGGRWGCSPDGITATGGCEIKCLTPLNHLAALLERQTPPEYIPQVQGSMFVCERSSWDFVLYTDGPIRSDWWTVHRDEAMHATLAAELPRFCDELDALEQQVNRGQA